MLKIAEVEACAQHGRAGGAMCVGRWYWRWSLGLWVQTRVSRNPHRAAWCSWDGTRRSGEIQDTRVGHLSRVSTAAVAQLPPDAISHIPTLRRARRARRARGPLQTRMTRRGSRVLDASGGLGSGRGEGALSWDVRANPRALTIWLVGSLS